MKILVVSEAFKMGGLETQIKTLYDNLPSDIEFVFAFGEYTNQVILENAKIYTDFSFSYSSTIDQFCEDVKKLVEIIEQEKIDVIHVHPYYSFFPAFFASQLTHKKLVYTYHGIGSFNFSKPTNAAIMFYYAMEKECISKVFSVSNYGINTFKNLGFNKTAMFPNPIDCKKFKLRKYVENGKWALFSRIDQDKFGEIKQIIQNMDLFNIKKIDIFGSGSLTDNLNQYIKDNNLEDKICYKGYAADVSKILKNKYNGVIGIGRLLIEAMLMGYPTILIGYNKITGFVNYKIYQDIKETNFINMDYNNQNFKMPSQLEIQEIYEDLKQRSDVNKVLVDYKNELLKDNSNYMNNVESLFYEIKNISENKALSNCYFYKEREIYNLIKKYIGGYTLSPIIDNLITTTDQIYELFDITTINLQELKGKMNDEKN